MPMIRVGRMHESVFRALGNPCRLRILHALWRAGGDLTVYRICRLTGLGRGAVNRHLKTLVEEGFVLRVIHGEIPLYRLNKDSQKVKALSNFFKSLRL